MRRGYRLQVTGYSHWKLIIDDLLPGLRSQGHFGRRRSIAMATERGVGKIVNCKLKIVRDEASS